MKYKGLILVIVIAICLAVFILLPKEKIYEEIAAVGKPAPAVELKDADGNLWKLSDLRGKVVFLNFWATWCTTCKSEMPSQGEAISENAGPAISDARHSLQGFPVQSAGILNETAYLAFPYSYQS